jgi:hypothetical protein
MTYWCGGDLEAEELEDFVTELMQLLEDGCDEPVERVRLS